MRIKKLIDDEMIKSSENELKMIESLKYFLLLFFLGDFNAKIKAGTQHHTSRTPIIEAIIANPMANKRKIEEFPFVFLSKFG